jgi:hypothetical protein
MFSMGETPEYSMTADIDINNKITNFAAFRASGEMETGAIKMATISNSANAVIKHENLV